MLTSLEGAHIVHATQLDDDYDDDDDVDDNDNKR